MSTIGKGLNAAMRATRATRAEVDSALATSDFDTEHGGMISYGCVLAAEVRALREEVSRKELERWNWEQSALHRQRERDLHADAGHAAELRIAELRAELAEYRSRELRQEMEDISEENYCAGWMTDLEQSLFAIAFNGANPSYGMQTVDDATIEKLRRLATESDSWWVWKDGPARITLADARQRFGVKPS